MNRHHMEVLTALTQVASQSGTPSGLGDRIQRDRRSSFEYLGLRTPDRRRRVKEGFSFTAGSEAEILAAWNEVWTTTGNGDVLLTPLDYYRTRPVGAVERFWPTVMTWIDRIDNWAHADDLARVYSRALEASPETVYHTLVDWSRSEEQWACRISMVSLIRYTGKNAAFMPADAVLDVVANCVTDQRDAVAKAVGWVLRETMDDDPQRVQAFLDEHESSMPAISRRRASERVT
jgi:hypothetical protein